MKEWKARTLRMAKPRKLCRAKLVFDMLVPALVGSLTVAGQAIISRAREAYAMLRHADNEPIGAGFRRAISARQTDLRVLIQTLRRLASDRSALRHLELTA